MSASREKKQRKGDLNEALTQKQRKEQAEQAKARRKTIGYTVFGVIVAVLVVILLVWNSGVFQANATAATVGSEKISVRDMQYYYYQAVNSEYSMYTSYGMSAPFDTSKPLSEQIQDEETGTTYQQYFQEQALATVRQVTALCAAAQAEGYTLSAEGQAEIDDVFEQIDQICAQYSITRASYFAQSYGSMVTEKVFRSNLEKATLAQEYANSRQDALTYTDEELDAYYQEHAAELDSYTFRSFYIDGTAPNPTDEDGNPVLDDEGNTVTATEEEQQAAMEEAMNKAIQAVAEIGAASDHEAAFIEAAPQYVSESSKESYTDNPDASKTDSITGLVLTQYGLPYAEWLMDDARQAGDVGYVESGSGYYVMLFLDRFLDEEPTVNIRHILIKAELDQEDDEATEDVDESQIPSQAALDAAKAEAESLLEQWQAGDKTAESFGALAQEYSDDTGSSSNGGEYTYVLKGQMFEAFDSWIFDSARQSGDTTLLENPQSGQQGWHVIYFEGQEKPYWTSTATSQLQSDDMTAWMEEIQADYPAAAAEGMSQVGK